MHHSRNKYIFIIRDKTSKGDDIMRREAAARLRRYLTSQCIKFTADMDNGVPRFTMCFEGYDDVPGTAIECAVWFYRQEMEVRTYYTKAGAEICKKHRNKMPALLKLLNYINARVWVKSYDGTLNELKYLYTPRIYVTEDECFDITFTTIVPYDFYDLEPFGTEDYITVSAPDLLADLGPAIFGVLTGERSFEAARRYIDRKIIRGK